MPQSGPTLARVGDDSGGMKHIDSNPGFAPRGPGLERGAAAVAELIATVVLTLCTVVAVTAVTIGSG